MRALLLSLGLVVALGSCEPLPPEAPPVSDGMCGGLQGLSCGSGSYCSYPPQALCGAADQTGMCRPVPEVCTMQYDPVCGCDGNTYSNACMAASAGVSVSTPGECG